jgi:carbon-monoxide dehydrogenase medium subunit
MKPVAFDYARPSTLSEALQQLANDPNAKVLAGGQTLAPLLNLRLVHPSKVVDITRIPELSQVTADGDGLIIGACVTHAAIEDKRFSDPTNGFLARIAHHIAYRAIRTRGTIGGSLVHADPAADWLSVCLALGADVIIAGPVGSQRLRLGDFIRGAMTTTLGHDEILTGIRITQLSNRCRTGFAKLCRKTGEFAQAMAAFVDDREHNQRRLILGGATLGRPIVLDTQDLGQIDESRLSSSTLVTSILQQHGLVEGSYAMNIQTAAIERALNDATAR